MTNELSIKSGNEVGVNKVKEYNIGDTIEFIQDSWGSIYPRYSGKKLIEGEKVITVEVKDIKTVMVTLDYPVRNIYEENA